MPDFLTTPEGRNIAYHKTNGQGPGVVFLGGFKSDMEGSKATAFEAWAQDHGIAYLRFDYSGHGQSGGEFTDGAIGDWAADAAAAISQLTEGPQILVGSSMGGWISLLMCKRMSEKVAGLVTIAAAPDFTEDGFWAGFDAAQRRELEEAGVVHLPSDYGDPYPITRRLIEEGRDNLVLRSPLRLDMPVRMLQGTDDTAVTRETALKLLDHIESDDLRLSFTAHGDHSFSAPDNLAQIIAAIEEVRARVLSQGASVT